MSDEPREPREGDPPELWRNEDWVVTREVLPGETVAACIRAAWQMFYWLYGLDWRGVLFRQGPEADHHERESGGVYVKVFARVSWPMAAEPVWMREANERKALFLGGPAHA